MTLFDIVAVFASILSVLIPLVLALEVVFFFWTIAVAIFRSDSADGVLDMRKRLIWSVVAIFVTVSVWGIVQFASSMFGLSGGKVCSPPQILQNGVSTCF